MNDTIYSNWQLTDAGKALLLNIQDSLSIQYIEISDGYDPQYDYTSATTLNGVNKYKYNVYENILVKDNTPGEDALRKITFILTNIDKNNRNIIRDSFKITELGIYVNDTDGNPVLFMYQTIRNDLFAQVMNVYDPNVGNTAIHINYTIYMSVTDKNTIRVFYDPHSNLSLEQADQLYYRRDDIDRIFRSTDNELLGKTKANSDEIENIKRDVENNNRKSTTRIDNVKSDLDQFKDTNSNQIKSINKNIEDMNALIRTMTGDTSGAFDTLNNRLSRVTNSYESYDEIYHSDNNRNLQSVSMDHIIHLQREIKTLSQLLKQSVKKQEIGIITKDSYNILMGIPMINRTGFSIEFVNNSNTVVYNKTNIDLDEIYDGWSDLNNSDLVRNHTSIGGDKGYNITIKFFDRRNGEELRKYTATLSVAAPNANYYNTFLKLLYNYITSPFGGTVIYKDAKHIRVELGEVVDSNTLVASNGNVPELNDLYLQIPPYINKDNKSIENRFMTVNINDTNKLDYSHIISRFSLINNTPGMVINNEASTSNIRNNILQIKETSRINDYFVIYTLLSSVNYIKLMVDRANQFNYNKNNQNMDNIRDIILKEMFKHMVSEVYTRGYKIPKMSVLREILFGNDPIVDLSPITYKSDQNTDDVKTVFRLNVDKFVEKGGNVNTAVNDNVNYTIEYIFNNVDTNNYGNANNEIKNRVRGNLTNINNLYKQHDDFSNMLDEIIEDVYLEFYK